MRLSRANACAWLVIAVVCAFASSAPALANWTGRDASNGIVTFYNTGNCNSVVCVPIAQPVDASGAAFGTASNPFFLNFSTGAQLPAFSSPPSVKLQDGSGNSIGSSSGALNVNCTAGCSGSGGGGLSVPFGGGIGADGTPGGFKDASGNFQALLGDVTSGEWVSVKASVLPTGAATQTTLAAIQTALGSPFQAGGSIGNTSFGISGTLPAFASTPTVNLGTLNGAATAANQPSNASIGSTTSGQTGNLHMGAVSTSAPSYTNGQTDPLSLTTTGALRVDASATTQPVSGTVTANLAAGSNLVGKVGIDQTTPGTTNGVQDASTSSTGSAAPSKASLAGAISSGNLTGIIQADHSAAINVSTATTTQLVALSSGKSIYVTAADVIAAGTGNITFEYGTGTACATGTTVLTGAYNLTAQAGLSKGSGLGPVWVIPAGNALCALTSAAVQMSGSVSYTQF